MSDGFTDMMRESENAQRYPYIVECEDCKRKLRSDKKDDKNATCRQCAYKKPRPNAGDGYKCDWCGRSRNAMQSFYQSLQQKAVPPTICGTCYKNLANVRVTVEEKIKAEVVK